MSKRIFVIRHGDATGNGPDAPLTAIGKKQAEQLADFFSQKKDIQIDRLIASPYKRATQTAAVLAERFNKEFCTDERLRERNLGNYPSDKNELRAELKKQFENMDLKFPNGESNREVCCQITGLMEELLQNDQEIMLFSHRLTMTVLLNHYDKNFGFEQGWRISTPDVYLLTLINGSAEVMPINFHMSSIQ